MSSMESHISRCMLADQARFRRRLRSLEQSGRRSNGRRSGLQRLRADMERSEQRRKQRQQTCPKPSIPDELPINARRAAIAEAIEHHPVVIVCGETGSGKTTQLPKICLELGRGAAGLIGHTQPRRVAARSVAARIAEELASPLGQIVGYKVRFNERISDSCYLKVMTDGMLLAEVQSDQELSAYDTIIIDEAHERSLNIDFLLGFLKQLLRRRGDLKLIISSATIDTERFSTFFDDAPVIEVSGRGHPVEVRYRPVSDNDQGEGDRQDAIVETVAALCQEGPGDVLVFLPGERDIRNLSQALRRRHSDDTEVLPVYARLPLSQQQRLFDSHRGRRIVLATNIAETSITVPNIRYVVDPGFARISRYSHRSTVRRLPVEPISRASADQRKGRCGRVTPGICVRLYGEEDFVSRPEFTQPEIQRTDLAAVLLTMRVLGIHDLEEFPFLDPPDRRRINDGLRMLRELGAIDGEDRLTALGRKLARLPVDPRVGRMILAADSLDCVSEVLIVASALSVPDPRERPPEAEAAAAASHQRFRDERSDFMSLIKLWDYVHDQTRGLGAGAVKGFCRKRFLSLPRLREWQEVHRELKEIVREMGLRPRRHGASYGRIHRALLAGLLRNVGFRNGEHTYAGVRDTTFYISRASSQSGGDAKWVVAAELVETARLYAHQVARIHSEWIERAAGDLIRRNYFDAHWDPRRGEVMVYEQTGLYGLTVTPKRRVRFAPVSRQDARAIFIQAGFVERGLASKAGFLEHNAAFVEALRKFEHKLRRPDVPVADENVYQFYDSLIPENICDAKSFEAWRRRAERESPERMLMDDETMPRRSLPEGIETDYPDVLALGERSLAMGYRFGPSREDDGITTEIPLDMLPQLDADCFEWLVPGLLGEKVLAMLRLLPKATRRELLPLADTAGAFLEEGSLGSGSLTNALREYLRSARGVEVPADAWQWSRLKTKLTDHLLMNFRILSSDGQCLGEGRDLVVLQRKLVAHAGQTNARLPGSRYEREGLKRWPEGPLPELVEEHLDGRLVRGHPALVDAGDSVALRLLPSAQAACEAHATGVRRLFRLGSTRELRTLSRSLPGIERMQLVYAVLPQAPDYLCESPDAESGGNGVAMDLTDALIDRSVARALPGAESIRDEASYEKAAQQARGELWPAAEALCDQIANILEEYRSLLAMRRDDLDAGPSDSLADVDRQLSHLIYRGFVSATPDGALSEYPRYLQALRMRLEKIRRGGAKDSHKVAEISPLWERFAARATDHADRARRDPELMQYRWMLEEYRISLFAQELGTAYRVSRKRLDEQWRKVGI